MKTCERCGEKVAVVGLGPGWLCIDCFKNALQGVGEAIHKFAENLGKIQLHVDLRKTPIPASDEEASP